MAPVPVLKQTSILCYVLYMSMKLIVIIAKSSRPAFQKYVLKTSTHKVAVTFKQKMDFNRIQFAVNFHLVYAIMFNVYV